MGYIFNSGDAFPCSGNQQMNMDWFLNEFLKIKELTDGVITERLEKLIDARFNELMINATYDAETETILLRKGVRK